MSDELRSILPDGTEKYPDGSIDLLAIWGHGAFDGPGVAFLDVNEDHWFKNPLPDTNPDDLGAVIRRKLSPRGHLLLMGCCTVVADADMQRHKDNARELATTIWHTINWNTGDVGGDGKGAGKWMPTDPALPWW